MLAMVVLSLGFNSAYADPGLVGQYFNDVRNLKALENVKADPFFVRADPQINFPSVDGDFYGSHLIYDFGVRWTGSIHIDKPGVYQFHLQSDDGSQLSVGDKLVIAQPKGKIVPMGDRAGEVTFDKAGDFPLKVDFNQQGGGAGCILLWKTPGAETAVPVPAEVLSHDKSAEQIKWSKADFDLFTTDHHAWLKIHGRKFEKMDYGPFLSGTFGAPFPKGNTTNKGIIISLDKQHSTNVLFDTQLCRYSAGWTGDYIDFRGVAYDGSHGVTPSIKGTQIFGTPVMPGWEHNGSFKDPRPNPYGNLPADWCHYRGLYRNGDETVLSYTVNGVGILDKPCFYRMANHSMFVHLLEVQPSKQSLTLVACDEQDLGRGRLEIQTVHGPLEISEKGSNHYLTIPAHEVVAQYGYAIVALDDDLVEDHGHKFPTPKFGNVDFSSFAIGGPNTNGQPLVTQGHLGVPDGPYAVDTITAPEKNPADAWLRFSGFDFFPDGHSAALCTWNGDVWIVKGVDDKLDHLVWQRYATGLFQPLGLKIVNGEVYVLGRDQITRLHDLNGDGEADFYENFNNDCEVTPGFHEFAHDLQVDSQGNFFYAKGGPVRPGGNGFEVQSNDDGCMMKISADGKHSEVYATGLRAPNGMSMGPNDQITVSDNQGTWTPACRISFVTKGSFLGVPDTSHLDPKPTNYGNPICWFPYVDGDYTQGDNSSGGAAWNTSNKWGPMDGKLIHLSYGTCSIFEMLTENVDGIWQGGAVRFPLDFDSGLMRARFNPVDGQLYVAGLKGWQTRAAKDGIFQRVRYTGKPVHMPSELHVTKEGMSISFTSPLDPVTATDSDNYSIEQWNYIWSNKYGSPEVTRDDPKKKGRDTVEIAGITLSADQKTIAIKISDWKPVMQVKTVMKIKAADGSAINYELDSTVNIVPGQAPIAVVQPTAH